MIAEDRINAWAASRLGLDPGDVQHVEFVHEDGYQMSEYTWVDEYDGIEVTLASGRTHSFSLAGETLVDIIREVLEVT